MRATKTCTTCEVPKPLDQFWPRHGRCKDCDRIANREYQRNRRRTNPEYREASRQAVVRYREAHPERVYAWNQRKQLAPFGLTPETYADLLARQGGRCAICPRTEPGGKGRWHVDHDHRCCGRKKACDKCRRGLLCFNCNIALGYLGDDLDLLRAAAAYLASYGPAA